MVKSYLMKHENKFKAVWITSYGDLILTTRLAKFGLNINCNIQVCGMII